MIRFVCLLGLLFSVTMSAATAQTGQVLDTCLMDSEILGGYIAGTVVSIGVFAYMSWAYPTRPYLNALAVSFLAALFGVLSMTLLYGDLSWWRPVSLVLDIPELLVSVLLGTIFGTSLRRRCAAEN